MKSLIMVLFLLAYLGQSCSPADPDTKAPSLLLSSGTTAYGEALVCGEMAPRVFSLKNGESLKLELYAVDNEALSQLKIDIHENHDCHGHNKRTQDWYYQEIVDLDGNEARVSKSLDVPANVTAGNYHLILSVLDAAGNEASQQIYDISVMNTADIEVPVLTLDAPTAATLKVEKGEKVVIEATIADDQALLDGSRWRVQYKDFKSGNVFTLSEEGFDTIERSIKVSYGLDVPNTWVSGTYEVRLRAYDAVNNEADTKTFLLEVE